MILFGMKEEPQELSWFGIFIEILGWIRIAFVPFFVGSIIGALIYLAHQNPIGLTLGIFFSVLGLGLGILWATRIWRKHGTMNFLSKVDASPDLDHIHKDKDDSESKKVTDK